MHGGFAWRFGLEAGFLVLLAAGAGYANLRPVVIVALLAGGWLLVSLVELSVWLAQRPGGTVGAQPAAGAEQADEGGPEPHALEPEPVGWPVDAPDDDGLGAYPLRADADVEPSEEVEAYTRVLGPEPQQAGDSVD